VLLDPVARGRVVDRLYLAALQVGSDSIQALPAAIHVQQSLGLVEDPVAFGGSGHGLRLSPGRPGPELFLSSLWLLSGRPHRFGERLPAPLQLSSHPGRQIRVSPQLADEFADDIRRGDIPGLRVTAKEPVQVRYQVDCDPGRAACAAGGLRRVVPYRRYCGWIST
jgi:hypothetical protein